MTWSQARPKYRLAAEAMQAGAALGGDSDGAPNQDEREELARLIHIIEDEIFQLRLRIGIGTLVPRGQAPDWETQRRTARQLVGTAIDIATNYRPDTEPRSGAAVSARRHAVDLLRQSQAEFQRAGMEAATA